MGEILPIELSGDLTERDLELMLREQSSGGARWFWLGITVALGLANQKVIAAAR